MDFIKFVLSFLPTWVPVLVHRPPADQVVPQPDHLVTQKPEIKSKSPPKSSRHQSHRLTKASVDLREKNIKLQSDLDRHENQHQQELVKFKRQQRLLECKVAELLVSKDEKSEKIKKLMSHRDVLKKEIDNFCSDFICKDQRYQNELGKLKQRRDVLAEKKTRLLSMKDEQLEKNRNLLSLREVVTKEHDKLRRDVNYQQQEYQMELENQKQRQVQLVEEKENMLAFQNFKLQKVKRLLSEEESLSRSLKETLAEMHHSKEEVAAKLKAKEAESLCRDSLVKQLNEELRKARSSEEKLVEELSKKAAEYLKNSRAKDDRIKELEVAILAIKERTTVERETCKRSMGDLEILRESDSQKSSTTNQGIAAARSFGQLLPEMEHGPPQRKVYDRDTLMQLQKFVGFIGKREHLMELGILRESLQSSPTYGGLKPATRSFGQLLPGKEQGHQRKREIKLTSSSEKSRISDNPNVWKPKRASMKTDDCESTSTETTLKTVRGILNKLTPSNYQKLLQKIQELNIDHQDCLAGVIKILFDKAVDEPIFSPTYAKICLALSSKDVVSSSNPAQTMSFRKLLLFHCKKEFEKDNADLAYVESKRKEVDSAETEAKKKFLQQELNELVDKNRRVSLGNIKFIGELFNISVISFKVMGECIRHLLNQHEDEESLECLCKLLSTTGKEIELPLAADEAAKASRVKFMNSVIQRLETIIGAIKPSRKISSRIHFMIQGVIELRKTAWKPRRPESGPKVIERERN